MKIAKRLLSAALALTLPCAAFAQTPAEPAAAAPAPAATPAPTPAPVAEKKQEDPKPILTPYGFILGAVFFDGGGFKNKDNIWQAMPGSNGGAFLMSARGSRLGLKLALKDDNWTGAVLGGVLEYDFKAGHVPSLSVSTSTGKVTTATDESTKVVTAASLSASSSSWYNGLMRLRLANLTATWKGDWGSLQLLAGQDYGLVSGVNAETIAWTPDPIFTEAGNIWRRSPQFRLTYGIGFADMLNATVAAAILSPADSTGPVDAGVGNLSRRPDIEARAQVGVKVDKSLNATVGFGYHTNTKRFANATANQKDVTVNLWGLDADLNLTQYLQVKGEYYSSSGAEDSYTGMLRGGVSSGTALVSPKADNYKPLKTSGFWGQGIIKPCKQIWLTAGYGRESVADAADLSPFGADATKVRTKNAQMAFGLLFNAGKYWRFGVEHGRTTSTYLDGVVATSQQTAVSTQLKF
jgi:hypothetical protein